MIIALCMNPCWDKSVSLPRFQPDAPNRVAVERMDVGGKGVNVARAARELGEEALLVSFDFAGEPLRQAMKREGVPCALLPVGGGMRMNTKLRETETGRTLEINEQGAPVSEADLTGILHTMLENACADSWFTLSGSLPPGAPADTYRRFCAALQAWNCPVAVDCDGEALKDAIQARPALIKPNIQEFADLTGVNPGDERAVLDACRQMCARGVGRVCLSWGSRGAWLVSEQGAWACEAAKIEPKGSQGGGDTLLAGLLTGLSRGMPDPEALRFASAAAPATVMRPGTLLCQKADAEALLPKLSARELDKAVQ